jgi:hypothetical protein
MAYNKLKGKLKRQATKSPAEYLEEEEVSSPYESMDFNKTAKALEMGVSPDELDEITKKKRMMREKMDRLKSKQ